MLPVCCYRHFMKAHSPFQSDLFAEITAIYGQANAPLSNADLYSALDESLSRSGRRFGTKSPIGQSGQMHDPLKRQIRWYQQSLKQARVIERVDGQRGLWQLTESTQDALEKAAAGTKLVAFSTELGVAIWGRGIETFGSMSIDISLCFTSPPYPLRQARAYGNPDELAYVDFICAHLEPIVKNLLPGGCIAINTSQDIFLSKSPARSLYIERMILALNDRLGLALVDRLIWLNYSKPPGPTYWACVNRVQLTTAYEPIYLFTNDPSQLRTDNRRVLEPHTEQHLRLMKKGGDGRTASYGDGAYRLRPDSFGQVTEGKIARNVVARGSRCADTLAYRQYAKDQGLVLHGAMQPTSLADFFIRFCTKPGDLVVDMFGGTQRTGLAAERLGRRWITTEWALQYLRGASSLFAGFGGYESNLSAI
jgi:DNA modification methylase